MRQILFKAKRVDNGEWVEGLFTKKKIGQLIAPIINKYREWDSGDYMEEWEIDGETLCQYTGLDDKNGVKIFEGDLAIHQDVECKIIWNQAESRFFIQREHKSGAKSSVSVGHYLLEGNKWDLAEVTGNIHDQ